MNKWYACWNCPEVHESNTYLIECPACKSQSELVEADTKDIAIKLRQAHRDQLAKVSKNIIAGIEEQNTEEILAELRVQLTKGKWFIRGAEALIEQNPIYFDRTRAWWVWDKATCSWIERDETDILVMIRDTLALLGDTSVRHNAKLVEALRQVGRRLSPVEPPLDFIQFGRELVNIRTGERIPSTPKYFSTNQIPWNLGTSVDTPVMDSLIDSWVGREYRDTLYQIIAYCVYRDYPIHRIFCFVGTGANGKTRVFKIIEKFVGEKNKASVTLKNVGSERFAIYPLYRKTVCFLGETSHHRLDSTDILKSLSGQDPVTFEQKGRTAFTGNNYAKLIVGTNVLPPSTDTSRGWYRRWFILNFPNEYLEGEDVLCRIPEHEYNNLALKCVKILPELLRRGSFDKEGTIEQRRDKYIENSNPIKTFLNENYERDVDSKIRYTECYLDYVQYLLKKKLRKISKKEFSAALDEETLEIQRTSTKDPLTGEVATYSIIWGLRKRTAPLSHGKNLTLSSAVTDISDGAERESPAGNSVVPHPTIVSPQGILSFLRSWGIPVPRNVILENVDDSVGNYTNKEFWLDVTLRKLSTDGTVMCIGVDTWAVLE